MDITFKSTSKLIVKVINQLESGTLRDGDTLSIIVPPDQRSLPDLFVIGRLLAFIRELKNTSGIDTEFIFKPPRRRRSGLASKPQALKNIENLDKLGFFRFCEGNSIRYEFTEDPQLPLPSGVAQVEDIHERSMEKSTYWECLVPLQRHPIRQQLFQEREVIYEVGKFINDFSDQAQSRM
jgi:hypothetical protein